ncbi:hypothetical protein ACXQAU_002739 [Citrobacter freundii]
MKKAALGGFEETFCGAVPGCLSSRLLSGSCISPHYKTFQIVAGVFIHARRMVSLLSTDKGNC